MAKKPEVPQTHVIQRAPTSAACTSCERRIEAGELRLSEAIVGDDGSFARSLRYARTPRRRESYDDDDRRDYSDGPAPDLNARYYHLECAAKHVPMRLKPALTQCTFPIDNLDHINEVIQCAMTGAQRAIDPAADDEATRPEYERFIAQLAEATDDEGNVVFGDWLQTVNDPRGELVALQFQIESATGWTKDRLVETERKLLSAHRQLMPPGKGLQFVWRRGFVHAVAMGRPDAAVLQHPSLRLIRELSLYGWPTMLPATLRVLAIKRWERGDLKALASLAQLQRLELPLDAPLFQLQHPTLAELELAATTIPETLELPTRKQLPALRRLVLRVPRGLDAVIEKLRATKLLPDLELVLVGDLEVRHLEPLARGKLALLDLRGTSLAHADADAVNGYATRVELPPPPIEAKPKEWRVRHTKKREWGLGRVIEETEQGLRVEFEDAGEKLVRNVELLEDVD